MVVVELGSGAFQKTVVVKKLETTENRLGGTAYQIDDVGGTQKAMSVNKLKNDTVAIRNLDRSDCRNMFEAGKASRFHPRILTPEHGTDEGGVVCP